MKVKTSIKGGRISRNHNERLLLARARSKRLTVKTSIKAGKIMRNHNETLLPA